MRLYADFYLKYPSFNLSVNIDKELCGITTVCGSSGAGKTSFLRCLAGLEKPKGIISINKQIWQNENLFLPTHKRSIGYVFQDSLLFPHMSVTQNLEYSIKRAKNKFVTDKDLIIDILDIAPLMDRGTTNLSGGEKQRVAIARAIFTSPELLLFDEPLAALDNERKDEILNYIISLKQLNLPIIYVTHSIYEIDKLSDNILTVENGKIKLL